MPARPGGRQTATESGLPPVAHPGPAHPTPRRPAAGTDSPRSQQNHVDQGAVPSTYVADSGSLARGVRARRGRVTPASQRRRRRVTKLSRLILSKQHKSVGTRLDLRCFVRASQELCGRAPGLAGTGARAAASGRAGRRCWPRSLFGGPQSNIVGRRLPPRRLPASCPAPMPACTACPLLPRWASTQTRG